MDKYAIKQLSVFVENHKGELTDVTSELVKNDISLKSILLVDSTDFGILRMIVNEPEKAKNALVAAGFGVNVNFVFGVRIEDKLGSFNHVVKTLCQNQINILYTYSFYEGKEGIFVFKVNRNDFDNALRCLQEEEIEIVEAKIFYD